MHPNVDAPRKGGAGRLPLRRRRPAAQSDGANPNGSVANIAGIVQRARQRRRADAAPRARQRGGARQRRRQDAVRVARSREMGRARMSATEDEPADQRSDRPRSTASRADEFAPRPRHPRPRADLHRARHLHASCGASTARTSRRASTCATCRRSGPRVIQGPGENAGVVDIGDGQAVVFKMESHNHPSFIEPYQGAATGVGGILRDVFTMGARPIALPRLAALRPPRSPARRAIWSRAWSPASAATATRSASPPSAARSYFDACYDGNILVNAMAVGLARADRIFYGTRRRASATRCSTSAPRPAATASTARPWPRPSSTRSRESKRPTVQVGDPFTEKLLLEACLELMASDVLVGIQDMGAAGLTSSSVEMAARAGNGIELDLDQVPRRETGMTAVRDACSPSRRSACSPSSSAGREAEALAIFAKWDLDAAVIGRVTDTGRIVVKDGGAVAADIPVAPLAEGLALRAARAPPRRARRASARSTSPRCRRPPISAPRCVKLLSSPNLALQGVGLPPVRSHGAPRHRGAARAPTPPSSASSTAPAIRPTPRGWRSRPTATRASARSIPTRARGSPSPRPTATSPRVGAEPLAVTDCLNFGNPERPEVMWQLVEAIRGLGDACRALGDAGRQRQRLALQRDRGARDQAHADHRHGRPHRQRRRRGRPGVRSPSCAIALLGVNTDEIGGSEYLDAIHGKQAGTPPAARPRHASSPSGGPAARWSRRASSRSAHDCSEGGLAVALAESCIQPARPGAPLVGATVKLAESFRADLLLFGEAPSRIVVSYAPEREAEVRAIAEREGAPMTVIGATGGRRLTIHQQSARVLDVAIDELATAWRGGFRSVVS